MHGVVKCINAEKGFGSIARDGGRGMSCTLTDRCAGLRVGRRGAGRVEFGIGDRVRCPQSRMFLPCAASGVARRRGMGRKNGDARVETKIYVAV